MTIKHTARELKIFKVAGLCFGGVVLFSAFGHTCDKTDAQHQTGAAVAATPPPPTYVAPPPTLKAESPTLPKWWREPNISITAEKLAAAYAANEVAADEEYKGRTLRVNGKVDRITKDAFGNIWVYLVNPANQFMPVHAKLTDYEKANAMKLQKGTWHILECEGDGMMMGDAMLHECGLR